ncbi:MAG TPA: Holliday junction resolvase RuvX [Candidatus Acidoferrales bacterium]|nr:Holliday junction resolvase RuvX [Candidatus Acidoferrales bacterium]
MAIAALDLGRRRIGVAVTDTAEMGAHPIGIVERRALARDLAAIAEMLRDREIATVVVGLPLNMDGSEGPAARSARNFAERLGAALGEGVAVELFDERLTSVEARERMRGSGANKKSKRAAVDAIAAAVILEGWMQARAARTSGSERDQ